MSWLGSVGLPPDRPALAATLLALAVAWRGRRWLDVLVRAPRRLALGLLALGAALLSAAYVEHYLRGGPRVIDATSYWLQARALAEGLVSWPVEEPTASVRGRFLLMTGAPDAPHLGVIFPPGYPAVLALGFWLGHPLWIGPFLGALLVIATYMLARRVTDRDDVALVAAILSALSAALRYHTADTMAHGLAALLWAGTLAFFYGAADASDRRTELMRSALAGLGLGWLFATRPLSAVALLPIMLGAAAPLRGRARLVVALGALAPVALLVLEQRAVTGAFFASSQAAYYALADGPPGCFRYGFGPGIGCLHEHGDYVASVLPHGFDPRAAAITTLRRLRLHLLDIANAEPLALLTFAAPLLAWRHAREADRQGVPGSGRPLIRARRVILLGFSIPSLVLAYVPFYFDGSYPGGGARFFADVLPIEHVLLAISIALLVERLRGAKWLDFGRAAGFLGATCLLGFGVHASFEHVRLAEREGGRPYFEPSVLARAGVDRGLLFVGTDHAFNLAYDPRARDAARELVVAREYGDDRDRMIWERLQRPTSHRYVFDGHDGTSPSVLPWAPGPVPHPYRYEAEAEWPPLAQSGGHFDPVFAHGTCAWGGRLLAVRTEATDRPFQGTISFPVPFAGRFRIGVHLASEGEVVARLSLRPSPSAPPLATWAYVPSRRDFSCVTLPEQQANLSRQGLLEITAGQGSKLFLDAISLEPAFPSEAAR